MNSTKAKEKIVDEGQLEPHPKKNRKF